MHYRFGNFGYATESDNPLALLQQWQFLISRSPAAASAVQRIIQGQRRQLDELNNAPDLLTALPLWSEDRGWLTDLELALEEVNHPKRELRLLRCEQVEGPD